MHASEAEAMLETLKLATSFKEKTTVEQLEGAEEYAEKENEADDSDLRALVPELESRLHALQNRIADMEERSEELAAGKAESDDALRESRIAIELVTAERDRLVSQLEEREKALVAAKALAAERQVMFDTEAARGSELVEKLAKSRLNTSKEQEDYSTRWQAKVTALSAELERVRGELKEASSQVSAAKEAQRQADMARIEAEQRGHDAEQRAGAVLNEMAQLKAQSSQAQDVSDQMRQDNERRSKTFNAAVEAQVLRFRGRLEAERDTAISKLEDSVHEKAELQEQITEILAELQKAVESTEEHAAAAAFERSRVVDYEQLVATLQYQTDSAVQASKTAAAELQVARCEWEEERRNLKEDMAAVQENLQAALSRVQQVENEGAELRRKAIEWEAAAHDAEGARAAAVLAKEGADTAAAEATALRIQVSHLHSELDALKSSQNGVVLGDSTAVVIRVPTMGNGEAPSLEPSRSVKRELSASVQSFDLETSLRRTPLLPTSAPAGKRAAVGSEYRLPKAGSTRLMIWIYVTLIHVLLLTAMGRASHAHLACEHLHNLGGGLP